MSRRVSLRGATGATGESKKEAEVVKLRMELRLVNEKMQAVVVDSLRVLMLQVVPVEF